ncbi:hypothetical protein [Polyangium jinanense]|uniref:Phasin family protein n=1 Tax=Polyangium jinanense TaxID=2829994 RepID=A0A9X3WZ05_9BACT|nr:hypothetical protein [Polyangium jinanense]MDC3953676.1 hypothetical protein [Polyangium jinanense]MDC3979203.1 hypothetical protein [Polyangium jinanense]
MAKQPTNKQPKLLTRVVKGLGHWLGPETPTGKAFVAAEKGMTKAFDKLGRSERYLDLVGGALNRALRVRKAYVEAQENWLHLLRLPTSTEMDDLREEVRDVKNQIEALSSQLELVVDAFEKSRRDAEGVEVVRTNANGSASTDRPS